MKQLVKKIRSDEQGVLLVVALIVLGVIVLSGVYLSLILLSEIRSTRFADNAIIAHYVAETGSEEALWRLKIARNEDDPSFFNSGYAGFSFCAAEDGATRTTCLIEPGETGYDMNTDHERYYDFTSMSLYGDDFTAWNVKKNSVEVMDIYDPNLEGTGGNTGVDQVNVDWYLETCQGSSKLEITYTPIDIGTLGLYGPLQENKTKTLIDVCGCLALGSDGLYKCGDPSPSYASTFTVLPTSFYRISFRPLDTDVKKISVSSLLTSNPSLIPSIVSVETSGVYRDARASVSLRAHWRDALSGIFNYVIFSEESLIKDIQTSSPSAYKSMCGVCDDTITACSNDQECVDAGAVTCSTLNTTAFCSDGAPESYATNNIHQTEAGLCNESCNGYTFCGDGTVQTPNNGAGTGGTNDIGDEECDDGGLNSDFLKDACRTNCVAAYCGDGVVDTAELCDDGNSDGSDACDTTGVNPPATTCSPTFCGDGVIQALNGDGVVEACDDGAGNGTGSGECSSIDCIVIP